MDKTKVAAAKPSKDKRRRHRNGSSGAPANGAGRWSKRAVDERQVVDLSAHDKKDARLAEQARLLDLTHDAILVRDVEDRIVYWNRGAQEMYGFSPEEALGKVTYRLLKTKYSEPLATIKKKIERDGHWSGELKHFRRDGREIVVLSRWSLDPNGPSILESNTDITERKRAEEELRNKERAAMRLAAVVQSSHDAIVAKTLDGIITDWNKSAERIFGYKRDEIIGKSILTLIPKARHPEEKEIIRKISRGETIEHYETVRRRKNGEYIDVSLTISPVRDRTGKIVGCSKIARDITPLKKRERRLAEQARLLDLSNEAILVRDNEDRITYWNRGAEELYGYSAAEALGKVTHKLLRTEHSEPLAKIFQILERDDRWSGELIHRRKDGTKIIVNSHWAVDRDESGERGSVLETNSDITARKHVELALQRAKAMLEKLVLQRTRALRVANSELESEIRRRKGLEGQILEISDREQEKLGQELHDGLCQQLTAIGFLARAIALRLRDHRVVQVEELERIAQLINNSVMDARNIARDLHKEEIDAAEFGSALRDLVQRKIWQTSCRLELKTRVHIENDTVASQLYRILREAIINANKHSRATQVVLEVKRVKGNLVFSVTDNGVGFAGKGKGHGLGFHIMKYRAESIGARLELESLKRGGARVACYLPLESTK